MTLVQGLGEHLPLQLLLPFTTAGPSTAAAAATASTHAVHTATDADVGDRQLCNNKSPGNNASRVRSGVRGAVLCAAAASRWWWVAADPPRNIQVGWKAAWHPAERTTPPPRHPAALPLSKNALNVEANKRSPAGSIKRVCMGELPSLVGPPKSKTAHTQLAPTRCGL
jgi:hypothetical protein